MLKDGNGCFAGYRCANGANPCKTTPCSASEPCPSGQTCSNMLCWPSDGGIGDTGSNLAGVLCGNRVCDTGEICCGSMKALVATGCMAASACKGELQLTCDGPEDCGAGSSCCLPSGTGVQTACSTGGCAVGLAMCHTLSDCQSGELCCATSVYGYPTGVCQVGPCPQ